MTIKYSLHIQVRFHRRLRRPSFEQLDITPFANMDSWSGNSGSQKWMNSKREGDDFRDLPTGEQTFGKIRFQVIDPEKNNRKAVVAVSAQTDFRQR